MFEAIKSLMIEALNLPADKLTPTAHLADDLGIDSLDAAELIMELEDVYTLKITEEQAATFVTVGDIVSFIEAQKAS